MPVAKAEAVIKEKPRRPKTLPAVEMWLAERSLHPLSAVMRRLRDVILAADPRMSEMIQYGTIQFMFEGGFANFVQVADKKRVSLMFNRGGSIPGSYPHLEGSGPNARFMRFAGLEEANARAAELRRIAKAWCTMQAKTAKKGSRDAVQK